MSDTVNDKSLYEAAKIYQDSGIHIHPLRVKGKIPIHNKWSERVEPYTDKELTKYFKKELPNNLGEQCGKRSDCTIIDRDFIVNGIWDGLDSSDWVIQQRKPGRDHLHFGYCNKLLSKKYHPLGFEILNDGSNCVLTPSIHEEGQEYQIVKGDILKRPVMSDKLVDRITYTVRVYDGLTRTVNRCRSTFRKFFKAYFTDNQKTNPCFRDMSVFHGSSGRDLTLHLLAELKRHGATKEELHLVCMLIFLDKYNMKDSEYQINKIKGEATAKTATIKAHPILSQFYDYDREPDTCIGCEVEVAHDQPTNLKEKNKVLSPEEVIERSRRAKDEFVRYHDLPDVEREIACNAVWRGYGLDMRLAKKAQNDVFSQPKEDSEAELDPLDVYSDHIIKQALDELTTGNPKRRILDTWHKKHVGDGKIGEVYACAFASSFITNSDGLHVKPSGGSGKGKSSSGRKFGELMPPGRFWQGSMSGKAALYHQDKIKPGTAMLLDDVSLSEDLISLIKQATTEFQTGTTHRTVKDQTPLEIKTAPRCVWLLNSVDGFDDEQLNNRFLGVDVDDSKDQDEAVFHHQIDDELELSTTVTDDVLICRCMYDILGLNVYDIRIPFLGDGRLQWNNKNNRRNFPMLKDIIRSVTLYKIFQREKIGEHYLATVEDFEEGLRIYQMLAESNYTNLTKTELTAMRAIGSAKGRVYRVTLETAIGLSQRGAVKLMEGENGKGGLISKVVGLRREVEPETRKIYYTYSGQFGLNSYNSIATLNTDNIEATINEFKQKLMACGACTGCTEGVPQLYPGSTCQESNTVYTTISSLVPKSTLLYKTYISHTQRDSPFVPSQPTQTNNDNTPPSHTEQYIGTSDHETSMQRACTGEYKPGTSGICGEDVEALDTCTVGIPASFDAFRHVFTPTRPLLESVHKYCRTWGQENRTNINSVNYLQAVDDYMKGYRLPDKMREPVEAAVIIYAKIPQPAEVVP